MIYTRTIVSLIDVIIKLVGDRIIANKNLDDNSTKTENAVLMINQNSNFKELTREQILAIYKYYKYCELTLQNAYNSLPRLHRKFTLS